MLAVKSQYEAWHELFRGVTMSANLGKEGLSASTRSLSKKHAEHAAEAIIRSFPETVQDHVWSALILWIGTHLDVALKPSRGNIMALRGAAERLARIMVLNARGGCNIVLGPAASSETRIDILEHRLLEAVDRFTDLLAAKIEKSGIRKAQQESKNTAESVARFAAEWLG